MHHGQEGGKQKTRKLNEMRKGIFRNRGEIINFAKHGENNFPEIGGNLAF